MALKNNSSIVLNIEKFIKDVENRPAIWNRNYHCNKPFLEQMWVELAAIHELPIVVLKAKWKGLRDNFRVEYKRIPRDAQGEFAIPPENHESKWLHYYALLFLTEHMRHRQPKNEHETSSFYFGQNPDNDQDYEQTLVEPDLSNGLIRIPDSDEEFDEDDDDDDGMGDPDDMPLRRAATSASAAASSSSLAATAAVSPPNRPQPLTRESLSKINNSSSKNKDKGSRGTSSSISSVDGGNNASSIGGTNLRPYSNGFVPTIKLKRPRLSEDDSNFNGSSTMDNNLPEDDDYHYLLSLHPYMKQLNAAQKLRIRTKIQKLIFKELYKEDLEETK